MIKVNAITCPKCKDTIYSRTRHDFRSCSCGEVNIDGGFDYTKIGAKNIKEIQIKRINVYVTKKELYDDWNFKKDKYGLTRGRKNGKI